MKKSFYKGVFWTLSVFAVIGVVLAIVGVVAYQGYEDVALKASYEAGKSKTTIQIKKKDITSSTNVAKIEKKLYFYE
jgi:cell division protein YceG involved in septum cleavage